RGGRERDVARPVAAKGFGLFTATVVRPSREPTRRWAPVRSSSARRAVSTSPVPAGRVTVTVMVTASVAGCGCGAAAPARCCRSGRQGAGRGAAGGREGVRAVHRHGGAAVAGADQALGARAQLVGEEGGLDVAGAGGKGDRHGDGDGIGRGLRLRRRSSGPVLRARGGTTVDVSGGAVQGDGHDASSPRRDRKSVV